MIPSASPSPTSQPAKGTIIAEITETYVVLEGTAEILIGDDPPKTIEPGDAITIRPGTAHYVRATADQPVRILAVSVPAWTEADHYPA